MKKRDDVIPRKRRVTSIDVARLAGVSQPTVSRAFAAGGSITAKKRDAVLAAAKVLNYVPNGIASGLATARTGIIAVICGSLDNPFYSESLQAFIRGLQSTDRQVLAFSVEDSRDSDAVLARAMRYSVDGIIVTSAHLSSSVVSLSKSLDIPVIMFNRHVVDRALPGVRCDNVGGGGLLARIFLRSEAQRFLIIRGDLHGSTSVDRVDGFHSELLKHGIADSAIEQIAGGSTYESARRAVEQRFSRCDGPRPDAVFAVSDIMALGCMDALRDTYGLRIPQDIMIAGFDGIREARLSRYCLTTIRQPIEKMIEKSIELLDQCISGDVNASTCVLPGTLIEGQTLPAAVGFIDR